jgi:hypothetical protein
MSTKGFSNMRPNIILHSGTSSLLFGLLLLLSTTSQSKTLYVDPNSGNDGTTWEANGPSNPWRTIGRAAWGSTNRGSPNAGQAAQAGDTVVIAAGIYSSSLVNAESGGSARWNVLYNPTNNGTVGNPITFVANGAVSIRAATWGGPVVGATGRNHIAWSGPFVIDETYIRTVPDTGPVVFASTTGSGIDGASIRGTGALWGDNHNGVRVENTDQVFIRNTRIDNFLATAGSTRNGTAMTLYNADDTLIEHNEFVGCAAGIYIKGVTDNTPMERTIVRYNIIRNMSFAGINLQQSQGAQIYQNVIRDNAIAFYVGGFTTSAYYRPVNDLIANNTIDGGGTGIGVYYGGVSDNLRLRNNIYTNLAQAQVTEGPATNLSGISNENNVYHSVIGSFANVAGSNYALANWKTTFRQDQVVPTSTTTDPQFVNVGQNDYRLLSGSPARMIGVDQLDLDSDGSTTDIIAAGAFVTGNETIGTGGVRPNPPTEASAD